jgi:hypothetical protein
VRYVIYIYIYDVSRLRVKDVNGGSAYNKSPSLPCTRPVRLKAGFGSNAKYNLTYWATTCHISFAFLVCQFCNAENA